MTKEEVIKLLQEELERCQRAPELNGCEMKPEWQRTMDVCRMAVEAIREQEQRDESKPLKTAKWKVFGEDTPQCTHCGMWMPFARYRRGQGTDARSITDFCPNCGRKMNAMPMCESCTYGNGEWKDDGICYACREQVWIPGKPHRQAGTEHI